MPILVEGDQIRKRVEQEILSDLELKGFKPYTFDYSDSKVMLLNQLEQNPVLEIEDVVGEEEKKKKRKKKKLAV